MRKRYQLGEDLSIQPARVVMMVQPTPLPPETQVTATDTSADAQAIQSAATQAIMQSLNSKPAPSIPLLSVPVQTAPQGSPWMYFAAGLALAMVLR